MNARPLVLLTDYGDADFYAGVTRAVIASASPSSRVVDLQHDIPSHDIATASFVLARSWRYLPDNAVVVVVVDPAVGTARRGLILTAGDRVLVGPDNGFASDLLATSPGGVAPDFFAIDEDAARRAIGLRVDGATFHGRDIFAPVAAAIARGVATADLARPVGGITLLRDVPSVSIDGGLVRATGRYVDHFGNILSDIPRAVVHRVFGDDSRVRLSVGEKDVGPLRTTYMDGRNGELIGIINSWGLVEVAVNGARAIDCFEGAAPRDIRFELHAR
jgi:S-adenosylmethionine hydrolase